MTVEQITCVTGGTKHFHRSVFEAKVAHGLIKAPTPPTPPVRMASDAQVKYVMQLGGDDTYARKLTIAQCSQYIDQLKGRAKVQQQEEQKEVATTSVSMMVAGLIDQVPNGYYAVREQDGAPITFMRLSRPKHGRFKDSLKVQTQHGPDLVERWVRWPSGQISRYHWSGGNIEDKLLLLIADWKGAMMLYSEKLRRCGRCNTELTVARSRFYGIGPECETHVPHVIDLVAEKKGGYWEEQPLDVQEKYATSDSGQ